MLSVLSVVNSSHSAVGIVLRTTPPGNGELHPTISCPSFHSRIQVCQSIRRTAAASRRSCAVLGTASTGLFDAASHTPASHQTSSRLCVASPSQDPMA